MWRKAGTAILAFALSAAVSLGCAVSDDSRSSRSSRSSRKIIPKKSVAKKTDTPKKSLAKSDGPRSTRKTRSSRSDRKKRSTKPRSEKKPEPKPLADVEEKKKPEPPEVKKPKPAPRPPKIAPEEPEALAERREQIEECEFIPIPHKRDFWLSTYYMTGELVEPKDERSTMEKREPHQAVVQIRLENRAPVYYFNGKRVSGADQLEVMLITFREDVIAERHGNKYLQPEVIIDADKNAQRKHIETLYNACFWARINNIKSADASKR